MSSNDVISDIEIMNKIEDSVRNNDIWFQSDFQNLHAEEVKLQRLFEEQENGHKMATFCPSVPLPAECEYHSSYPDFISF